MDVHIHTYTDSTTCLVSVVFTAVFILVHPRVHVPQCMHPHPGASGTRTMTARVQEPQAGRPLGDYAYTRPGAHHDGTADPEETSSLSGSENAPGGSYDEIEFDDMNLSTLPANGESDPEDDEPDAPTKTIGNYAQINSAVPVCAYICMCGGPPAHLSFVSLCSLSPSGFFFVRSFLCSFVFCL